MESTPLTNDPFAIPPATNGQTPPAAAPEENVTPETVAAGRGWKGRFFGVARFLMLAVLLGGVILVFAVLALGLQIPGLASARQDETVSLPPPLGVKLLTHYRVANPVLAALRADGIPEGVLLKLKKLKDKEFKTKEDFEKRLEDVLSKDERKRFRTQVLARAIQDEHTLAIPRDVRSALGILQGKKQNIVAVRPPTTGRPLVLPGTTALDPTKVMRVRARFAPAEVVSIGMTQDTEGPTSLRELRSGDRVSKDQVLGIFYSVDVGQKKNDLFDALVQMELDQEILARAEKARQALPEVFILNARRNVQGDRNAINRAENTLRAWGVPEEDIKDVHREAQAAIAADGKANRKPEKPEDRQKANQEQLARWARVTLKAPDNGIIVERNVGNKELVVDNTLALFQIAKVNRLLVQANAPEDNLRGLLQLRARHKDVPWTIHTLDAEDKGVKGWISDISYLIDVNQHSAVVKGYIDNPGDRLRSGQFITATINVPPPEDVVEVPVDAVVDDGRQCVVFVEDGRCNAWWWGGQEGAERLNLPFTLRRVEVTHRYDKVLLVRSRPFSRSEALTPAEEEQGLLPRQPLLPGERVLTTGVLELKKELEDRESR